MTLDIFGDALRHAPPLPGRVAFCRFPVAALALARFATGYSPLRPLPGLICFSGANPAVVASRFAQCAVGLWPMVAKPPVSYLLFRKLRSPQLAPGAANFSSALALFALSPKVQADVGQRSKKVPH